MALPSERNEAGYHRYTRTRGHQLTLQGRPTDLPGLCTIPIQGVCFCYCGGELLLIVF